MKYASRLLALCIALTVLSSCTKEASLNIKSSGFDYNAVVSVYPTVNTSKAILSKSLKSVGQNFRIPLKKPGFGRLELSANGDTSFWIYLDDGAQEIEFDARDKFKYPVRKSSSKQGNEIIDYYKLESSMSKAMNDSLKVARTLLDNSTSETVIQAANNYNRWTELKDKQRYSIVKEFSRLHPDSYFTLMMIEEDPLIGKNSKNYLALINGLPAAVKDSEEGKKIASEVGRTSSLEVGATMAPISGTDPFGKEFDAKILKKVNLFICWVSYDNVCRKNNPVLVTLYEKYKDRDVEFVSISYDKYRKWWTTVIKDDKLTWPQYSDLLHAKSPNPGNLSNYRVPYMFTTDRSGVILSQDLGIDGIALDLETFLKKR